jgi:SAM-dependent methyltransferase
MSRLERLDERYHAHHGNRQEFVFGADERATLIASLVGGPGLDVLDLGCRTGALTQHYAEGNNVVGVDVDRAALEQAVERLGIETVWADVEEGLPFDDASFDVVVAGELRSTSPTPQPPSRTCCAC